MLLRRYIYIKNNNNNRALILNHNCSMYTLAMCAEKSVQYDSDVSDSRIIV